MSVNDQRREKATVLLKAEGNHHTTSIFSIVVIITTTITGTASENSRTFIFGDEDHTLGNNLNNIIAVINILILILLIKGNSLRHVLMQQKETEFCGYSVPHPYEPLMNIRYSNTIIIIIIIIIIIVIRLQTKEGGPTAIEVLKMGCQVIISLIFYTNTQYLN